MVGVAFNLFMIGLFKYADFFADSLNLIDGVEIPSLELLLPLGISFFTFQQISFLVGAHRQTLGGYPTATEYSLFVSFFPQLIAGPICQPKHLLPQIKHLGRVPIKNKHIAQGFAFIVLGLFKKVVIADSIGALIEPAFARVELLSFYDAWSCALGYTLQLYFDFSAYCEMAIGIGLLFGVMLPINFNSPYKSENIQDFWRRWHITLGAFLREYLYIPLGGSQFGAWRTAGVLILTMLLGGLWHGAGWQFIVWGLFHGLLLVALHVWRLTGFCLPRQLSRLITFIVVLLAWVMFRCNSVEQAWLMYETMFGLNGWDFPQLFTSVSMLVDVSYSSYFVGYELWLMLGLTYGVFRFRNVHELVINGRPSISNLMGLAACLVTVIFNLSAPSTFLYFQF